MAVSPVAAILHAVNAESPRPIRICLAVLPDLARGLLREVFARYPDIEVIDIRDDSAPPAGDRCNVIVTSARARLQEEADGSLQSLLTAARRNTLVVSLDGSLIMMFEFRPRQRLIDPSPDALVAAVRDEVAAMAREE